MNIRRIKMNRVIAPWRSGPMPLLGEQQGAGGTGRAVRHQGLLPNGLSKIETLDGLSESNRRILSGIQARSYGNLFSLLTGDIGTEPGSWTTVVKRAHLLGALMPPGYAWAAHRYTYGSLLADKPRWTVFAFACHRRYTVHAHYRESLTADSGLSDESREVFLLHWHEERSRSASAEASWRYENTGMPMNVRDLGIEGYIEVLLALDEVIKAQSIADGEYYQAIHDQKTKSPNSGAVRNILLQSYRWQFILSALQEPRFQQIMASMISDVQAARIGRALTPII